MSEVENEPMPAHVKAWSQRELLASIVSRHFVLKEELGGLWPTWIAYPVAEEDGDSNPHLALAELNRHLARLDWMADLRTDDPWKVRILPRPLGLFDLRPQFRFLLWTATSFSALLMGLSWVSNSQPDSAWTNAEVFLPALFSYVVPLIAALLLASQMQILIGRRNGMRIGGLLPFPLPLPVAAWPFGVIAAPASPKMDILPWPDREKMGRISLAAPLTMIIVGFFYSILGLWLTPVSAELAEMPNRMTFPLLSELVGNMMYDLDGMTLRGAWLHPLALAGQALMMMGWVSLLPLPGFPGGRVLISMMGKHASRSAGTQISLFLVICITGLMFGAFSGHPLWTYLTLPGAMLILFYGADTRTPMILDDAAPIDEIQSRKISQILFLALLLALPAEMPTEYVQDWDEGVDWSIPDSKLLAINETGRFSLMMSSDSLSSNQWSLTAWAEGGDDWLLTWACPDGMLTPLNQGCEGFLPALGRDTVDLEWSSPNQLVSQNIVLIHLWIEDKNGGEHHTIELIPDASVYLSSHQWTWDRSHQAPQLCTEMSFSESTISGNLSLVEMGSESSIGDTTTLWDFSGNGSQQIIPSELADDRMEVCLNGEAGAIYVLNSIPDDEPRLGLRWTSDDGLSSTWAPSLSEPVSTLLSTGEEMENVSNWDLFPTDTHLLWAEERGYCDPSLIPRLPSGENDTWNWNLNLRREGRMPDLDTGVINLTLPQHGWLMVCESSILPAQNWPLGPTSGPLALTNIDGELMDTWTIWEGNQEYVSIQVATLSEFELRNHGDVDTSVSIVGQTLRVDVEYSATEIRSITIWSEVTSAGTLEIHIAAWEIGG